jgi:hypothetical protein
MKEPIRQLGLLLLSILLIVLSVSLVLFLAYDWNSLTALGIGAIILIVLLTFMGYLLYDYYCAIKAEKEL